jgi:GT2 family glycosyltransferase
MNHESHLVSAGKIVLPKITVVVPTRNRWQIIEETISALRRLDYPNYEVQVIDQSTNALTKAVVERVARGDDRIKYRSTTTVGSSAGRNLGAHLSDADVVAYTDDDCIVMPDWLTALAREYEDPAVVAVYGRLLPYERRGRTGTEVGFKDDEERRIFRRKVAPWHVGHGGNMSFRRATLLTVGGFDPLLSAGGLLQSNEDQDIAYRLLARRECIVYCPTALAYHKHWKSWPQQKEMEHAYGIGAGAQSAKYLRCHDTFGVLLFGMWIWHMGVRRLLAGWLKWRSRRVMYLGLCQLIYPWIGLRCSLCYRIDRDRTVYVPVDA